MKKLIVILFAASSFALTLGGSVASGGDTGVGNGGDGVVCRDSKGVATSVELLDYYEGNLLFQLKPSLGDPSIDWHVKASNALGSIAKVDPDRSAKLIVRLQGFEADARFLSGITLTDVSDTGNLALPAGCEVEQLAVQRPHVLPDDKTFTINADLWNLLSNDDKAGLVTHEIIYEKMIADGQTNSIRARYYNARLAAGVLSAMSVYEYFQFLQELAGFAGYVVPIPSSNAVKGNWTVAVQGSTMNPDGSWETLKFGAPADYFKSPCSANFAAGDVLTFKGPQLATAHLLSPDSDVVSSLNNVTLVFSQNVFFNADGSLLSGNLQRAQSPRINRCNTPLPAGTWIGFFPNGEPQDVETDQASFCVRDQPVEFRPWGSNLTRAPNSFEFYQTGQLMSGVLVRDTEFGLYDQVVPFAAGSWITFYDNGIPKQGQLANTMVYALPGTDGYLHDIQLGATVELDEQGRVKVAPPSPAPSPTPKP